MASGTFTTTQHAIILKPGESFTLPPNGTLVAITGQVSSTCDNVPEPEDLVCYHIGYALDKEDSGTSQTLEHQQVSIVAIYALGIKYDINVTDASDMDDVINQIVGALPSGFITNLYTDEPDEVGDYFSYVIHFKALQSIGSTFQLEFHSGTMFNNFFFKAVEEDCL